MPLVSGVCRQASAPMLSHGGSRLNASKPEANPKTRYPQQHKHLNTPSSAVVCPGFVHTQPANCESLLCCGYSKGTSCGDDKPNRHSDFLTVVVLLFREILTTCFSIESPHKPLLHAQPRWRQVSHIITRILLITTFACCPVCNTPTRDLHLCCDSTSPDLHPKAAKANTTFSNPNVPLQTRGHALAGISGMLRSLAGAQGAFTSRGAKPKGLYLMLLGLTTKQQQQLLQLLAFFYCLWYISICVSTSLYIYLATTFSLCVPRCLHHFVVVMWRIPLPFSMTNASCASPPPVVVTCAWALPALCVFLVPLWSSSSPRLLHTLTPQRRVFVCACVSVCGGALLPCSSFGAPRPSWCTRVPRFYS